jgi:hypothetical protein
MFQNGQTLLTTLMLMNMFLNESKCIRCIHKRGSSWWFLKDVAYSTSKY